MNVFWLFIEDYVFTPVYMKSVRHITFKSKIGLHLFLTVLYLQMFYFDTLKIHYCYCYVETTF